MPAHPDSGRSRSRSESGSKRSGSRYVLGDLLGRGGMAEVFAGYSVGDHGFQKPVAIKRLLPELANDEVFVDRLIEEAKLLVGMQHGQIVSVLDLAREGDDVFLVMEFVDGPSLRQLIKARGQRGLSLGVATYIVQAAAAGLEFAHNRPGGAIIHADISPSNILLTTSGEVRVADFGIARREGYGQGVVEGKWAYMAPEQARGEALTPASDVFALGVVLYELLTGQHPFGRAVSASHRDDQIRVIPPRQVKPGLPAGLDKICMRALAHDPRDRYPRMQTLIDALVEERFSLGYRETASDLANTIREVAPRAEGNSAPAAPRTMHTERPITLMTRSLLRDATPVARKKRPSNSGSPVYPMGPMDPPPRDAFPMQPTIGVQAMDVSSSRRGSSPSMHSEHASYSASMSEPESRHSRHAIGSSPSIQALPPRPSADSFVPPSGEHTVAREVDQIALANAANAAAKLLKMPMQVPGQLAGQLQGMMRADGTPLPSFGASAAAMRGMPRDRERDLGEELASVVGGHTVAGGGNIAVPAMEDRGSRWTIGILAIAAVFGVIAAVVFQLRSERANDVPAPTPAPVRAKAPVVEQAPAPDREAAPAPTVTEDRQVTLPPAQPPIEAPQAAPVEAPPAPAPVEAPPAPAPVEQAATNTLVDQAPAPAPTPAPAPVEAVAAPVAPAPAPVRAKKPSNAASHRKGDPGILQVSSQPWSWVTVGNDTKETPAKFYLPAGTYLVELHNQENGLVKTERVTIEAGKAKRMDKRMDH